jgi:hypothetical protein
MHHLFLLGALVLGAPSNSSQSRVLVFPLEAREISPLRAQRVDADLSQALRGTASLSVIESRIVSRELRVDLRKQAQECNHDVLCLVQLGEMVQSQKILLGQLKEGRDGTEVLRLTVIDVRRAVVSDTLLWTVPDRDHLLAHAAHAAARHLFSPPNATLLLDLEPSGASLSVYGEPLGQPPLPRNLPFWSGKYFVRLEHPGYLPQEVLLTVRRGRSVKVAVELEPDPLYVAEDTGRAVRSTKSPRKLGVGRPIEIGDEPEDAEPEDSTPSPLLHPYAWAVIGVGALTVTGGALVMNGAQADYNDLSAERRYQPGVTLAAPGAVRVREDARSRHSLGSVVAFSGAVAIVGGAVWMLIDGLAAKDADADGRASPAGARSCAPIWHGMGGLVCSLGF